MKTDAFIAGQWVDTGRRFAVTDPSNDETVADVTDCGADEVRAAIDAAVEAQRTWAHETAGARAAVLRGVFDAMKRDREALALLMTTEQGKPLAEARGEVDYAAGFIEWAAEEGRRVYGSSVPSNHQHKRMWALRQPVGVTAAITPWNFPLAMITRKLGPALAAGCAQIVKPAEQTPLSALALAALAEEAGLPKGLLSVLPTSTPGVVGEALTGDARVRKISFTGSTEVGRLLMGQCAQNLTRLSLELGGHAPAIVFDDADLDLAVREIVAAKFRNAGQTCVCVNRVFVQRGVEAAFVEKLAAAVGALRVGPGRVPEVEIGPLIDDAAMAKVAEHVEDATSHGASIVVGGGPTSVTGGAARYFQPTVLSGVTKQMRVMTEETFGPVAPVVAFETEDEAVQAANDTAYGLAAYFFTRDMARVVRVSEALDFGIVGANDGRPSAVQAPFGGVKASGFGREGGKWGMDPYLVTKYVSLSIE